MPFATLLRCAGPVTPFALAGLSATSHAQSKGNAMSGLVGKPFSATREKRLAVGWAPVETNLTTAKGAAKRERGEAGKYLAAGFVEIERCTGGARNYCFLNYKRRGTCLRLRTIGELDLPASDPKVHGAGDSCPSKQQARR